LARVHERLRPGYVHDWIANPKRFLPYTGMPVNIPFDKPVSQDLYKGTSDQQVAALTDLLMHFGTFAKSNLRPVLEAFLRQAAPAVPQTSVPPPAGGSAAAAPVQSPPAGLRPAPGSSGASASLN
jgi:cytochrome c1